MVTSEEGSNSRKMRPRTKQYVMIN